MMNRVDRLMGYLLLFQSRGLMRAQDFAAQFEISERTVYRDIQALCEVGVPIAALPGEGYRLLDGYYLPPVTFSEAEGAGFVFGDLDVFWSDEGGGDANGRDDCPGQNKSSPVPKYTPSGGGFAGHDPFLRLSRYRSGF